MRRHATTAHGQGRLHAIFWAGLLFGAFCDMQLRDESLRIDVTHPKPNQQLTDIVRSSHRRRVSARTAIHFAA
jgi:hypothetical protein